MYQVGARDSADGIHCTKLQKAIFWTVTRRVALESKKVAYESLVLSLLSKFVWLGMLGCIL